MKPGIKILIIAFVLSLPFFWGINHLEKDLNNFLFWHELSKQRDIFTAQILINQKMREARPLRDNQVINLEIEAKSAISVLTNEQDKERILFEKNIDQKLALASLAKLMTAWVVLEHYNLQSEIIISEQATNQHGNIKLEKGKAFSVEYLLYPLLIESSNGAAFALAHDYQELTEGDFIRLMNQEAKKIGMENTFFKNSSGLDPEILNGEINYSTVKDLVRLTKKLLEKPIVWEILSIPKYTEYGPELINTNILLNNNEVDWQERIIGGKTGYTREAGGCLLLVVKMPRSQGFIINVVLGANGRDLRFQEMKKLVDWIKIAYKW